MTGSKSTLLTENPITWKTVSNRDEFRKIIIKLATQLINIVNPSIFRIIILLSYKKKFV